jgi:hypothetical protein
MPRLGPIRQAPDEQLARWLAELLAARSLRLPDVSPSEHAADVAWLDQLAAAIQGELDRRAAARLSSRDRRSLSGASR